MITDHDHEWQMSGIWRGPNCARCGEPVSAHLSWGVAIAEKVGGEPLDYISS